MTQFNLVFLSVFSLLTLTTSYGQGKEDKSFSLSKIKSQYQQINKYKNYKTVIIDKPEDFLGHNTDNGGNLTGYYKGDSLKKVVEWVGLSNNVNQNEYFYNNDTLFFVLTTISRYHFNDSTQTFEYSKFDNVLKGRYYFRNDSLLKAILDDKTNKSVSRQDILDFINNSRDYLKLLKAKRI